MKKKKKKIKSNNPTKKQKLIDSVFTKIPQSLKNELKNLKFKMEGGIWSSEDLRALGVKILSSAQEVSKGFASKKKRRKKK